jgi:hypothetical protein
LYLFCGEKVKGLDEKLIIPPEPLTNQSITSFNAKRSQADLIDLPYIAVGLIKAV